MNDKKKIVPKTYKFDTLSLHAGYQPHKNAGSRQVPIYQTTSYIFDDVDHAAALFNLERGGHIYSRISNPTVAVLEERVASLEGGTAALATSSGMSGGHTSDGGVAGADGYKGVDLVVDFVNYDAAHAGLRFGMAAQVELPEETCKSLQRDRPTWSDFNSCGNGHKNKPYAGTSYLKLQLGPLHIGTQATFKSLETNKTTAVMNQRAIVGGAALVFGDTLSVSYGIAKDKYRYNNRNRGANAITPTGLCNANDSYCGGDESNEYVTQKYSGWSAALNLGPVALKGTHNRVKGDGRSSIYAQEQKHSELNLSIAF